MNLITCLSFGWHLDYELTSQIAMLASTYLTERFVQSFFFICRILRDGVGWNHSVYIDFQRGPWNRAPLRSPCFTESSMASRFVASSPSIASWQNNIREIVPVFFIHHSNEYDLRFVIMSWLSVSLKYVKMMFGRLYHIYGMWNAITRGLLMYRKCRTFALEI